MDNSKSVVVFGSNGLFGSSLVPYLKKKGYNVSSPDIFKYRNRYEFYKNENLIINFFLENSCDVIINLIALTDVDRCQSRPDLAFDTNVKTLIQIIKIVSKLKINKPPHLIHFSTDQIYDGEGYHKEENACPINVYGLTKLLSEEYAKQTKSTILRTNFFGKSKNLDRYSFSDWIYSSLKEQKKITAFKDINFSAININSLCEIISLIIDKEELGIFNVGSRNGMSKADFIIQFATELNFSKTNIILKKSSELNLMARRPKDMRLNVDKIETKLGIKMPYIENEIKKTVNEYTDE